MYKFIYKTLIAVGVAFALIFAIQIILMNTRSRLLSLPEDIKTIYLGNSTVECAVNDNLIPGSFNFARSAEPMNYLYAKLKLMHKLNPQIDTVRISFDDIILFKTDLNYPTRPSLYFLDQFELSDWYENFSKNTFEKNTNGFTHLYDFNLIRPMLASYYSNTDRRQLDLGGYNRIKRQKLDIDIARHKDSIKVIRNINNIPELNLYYLDKMVEYCKNNRIVLEFFSTPKHNEVWNDSVYRALHRSRYPQITLLDYMQLQLPDSCYGDCSHLNDLGSDIFTTQILQ